MYQNLDTNGDTIRILLSGKQERTLRMLERFSNPFRKPAPKKGLKLSLGVQTQGCKKFQASEKFTA
jgi:hypothetical protein